MIRKRAALAALGCLLIVGPVVSEDAHARKFETLYAFAGGSDGAYPSARVLRDRDGNLFGTTAEGGDCARNGGCGTAFELSADGTESVLHSFSSRKGIGLSGLIRDRKGNLYGTAAAGGTGDGCGSRGCGVVFEVTPRGKEKILYTFQGGNDGAAPSSGLLADAAGDFYGTTTIGGGNYCKLNGQKVKGGCGTVFKLAPDGMETVLHPFQGREDGQQPNGDLILDEVGNLYGTSMYGGGGSCFSGAGCGTVFKIAPDGTETVIHAFTGTDGVLPSSGVILDAAGNLYGTTEEGGGSCNCGVIFRIAPDGAETVLYDFCSQANCTDGADPTSGLILDYAGNLYGTTFEGGDSLQGCNCGVVYRLAADGTETILHAFDSTDGALPVAGLIMDKKGTLYGTTSAGGSNQRGTVFSIAP